MDKRLCNAERAREWERERERERERGEGEGEGEGGIISFNCPLLSASCPAGEGEGKEGRSEETGKLIVTRAE